MLRVLHYIPGFLYGGIESMFLSWYKNIDFAKIQFELLLRTQDDSATALCEYRDLGGVYYRLAPISIKGIGKFRKSVDDFFRKHHNYDILHAHEADPFVLETAKKYGIKKIVLHSHSTSCGNSLKEKIRFYDEKISMRFYVDYAFACSKLAAEWKFGGLKFKKNDVTIVHNAIMTEKYDFSEYTREQIRKKMSLKNNFVLGHVGRMCIQKNQSFLIDVLVECLKKHENTILMMIGDGPDAEVLKAYAEKKKVEKQILFLGVRNDVNQLLQGMDCFLLSSMYEGLPVTLIEAQAAGLPCVISNSITNETEITDAIYRLSIEESPLYWAEKIEQIRKNFVRKSTREQITRSGFDVSHEVVSLVNKYHEIAEVEEK